MKRVAKESSPLVQFRVDETFFARLSAVAERLQTPVGVLARQWVAERLREELILDRATLQAWRIERQREILKTLQSEMEAGPAQIILIQPLLQDVEIDAAQIRSHQTSLAPVERTDEFTGRINALGYRTQKIFRDMEGKQTRLINGYVQVFRSGQLESVRILHELTTERAIFGDQIEQDLIAAVWSYGGALQSLGIPLPLEISVWFHGLSGYKLRSRKTNVDLGFDCSDLSLPSVEVNNWDALRSMETVAALLDPVLTMFWNAGGYTGSPNQKGTRRPPS